MKVRTTRFTLTDSDGEEHLYECAHFKLPQRFKLQLRVAKISGGVLARAAQALAPALGHLGGDPATVKERMKLAAGAVDWEALAVAIESLPAAIEAAGGFKLIQDALRKTTRERHEPTAGDGPDAIIPEKLDSDTALDNAYGAGDMVEMYQAVIMALAINTTPFGKKKSASWKELSGLLMSKLPQHRTKSTETPTQKSVT